MNKYLDINFLQKNCSKIHAFGLGFIQIKLDIVNRVHVYCQEAGLTTQDEEIHNHRYDFTSQVLKGKLINKVYSVQIDNQGQYLLVNEACNPDVPKNPISQMVSEPKLMNTFVTIAGSEYFLDKDTFHRVQAENGTITWVQRGVVVKEQAQIVHPMEMQLTCPFSVNLPEKQLWEIVRKYL